MYYNRNDSGDIDFAFKDASSSEWSNKGTVNFLKEEFSGMSKANYWNVGWYKGIVDMSVCQDEWEMLQLQMLVYRWLNMNTVRMIADTPLLNEVLGIYRYYKRFDSFRYVGVPFWETEMCGTYGLFDNLEKGVEYYGYCKGDRLVVEDMYGEMYDMNYWLFEPCTMLVVGTKGMSDASMEMYKQLGFEHRMKEHAKV